MRCLLQGIITKNVHYHKFLKYLNVEQINGYKGWN